MSFNNVTTSKLDLALRALEINLDYAVVNKIIDVVKLMIEKDGNLTLEDLETLRNT